jgi:hypothetical protein
MEGCRAGYMPRGKIGAGKMLENVISVLFARTY